METSELLKKVRKIELKTKGCLTIFLLASITQHLREEEWHLVKWNISQAMMSEPLTGPAQPDSTYLLLKCLKKKGRLTVMLIVSGSKNFGTQNQFKQELVTELAAVLAFSAIQNNDKIGVIFFSDKVEKFILPKKGKSHILRIIRELIAFDPENTTTKIAEGLRFFNNVIKKRSVCFVISDFMDSGYDAPLKIANKKHDVIAIKINDPEKKNYQILD